MADYEAKWYVIHTYSGYENKVATDLLTTAENRNLKDMIIDVKVPTEIVTETVGEKTKEACAIFAAAPDLSARDQNPFRSQTPRFTEWALSKKLSRFLMPLVIR